ncbi:MAG: SLBB domain-containing protein, partial [Acidobacteria bacterium]|nr:SLBB domain-containing protein [Acidobacteriota bacterium]
GHVERPGVYEHPHGVTLGEVIGAAGGVRGGKDVKAVLLGGAAGGFVGPDWLDARLTFEDARAGGYTLGSGVVLVFDESTDLVDLCLRIARFFRDESCGQCVPCRVGTVRQEEALHRLVIERTIGSRGDELALLTDVAEVMRDASICGLGQTAANAVQSAIATFGLFDREATG